MKMIRGMEHLSCEDRLRDMGLLAWRRLQGDIIAAFHYKGAYEKDGERFFEGVRSDRTMGNSFRLKEDLLSRWVLKLHIWRYTDQISGAMTLPFAINMKEDQNIILRE
ncbi:hypothetical protein BTVI_121273 [Pitangus sulphuratus]|nr:hypothetical protein BTVI_121273 [Pitangus sulphuratus]